MSIINLIDPNDFQLNINDSKKFWVTGIPVTNTNTTDPFTLAPNSTGYKGSKTISDELLFSKPLNTIRTNGHSIFSVLNTTSTRTVITLTIDATPYTLIDDTFTGAETIVNQYSEYNVYYKFIPVGTQFDILVFGDTHYSVPPIPVPLNIGNVIMRPVYAYATNGGLHFTRGSTYELQATYQFSIASVDNNVTVLHSSAEILQTL